MYIDKSLPRPAPTAAYSWRNLHPDARLAYIRDHAVANDELARLPHGVYGFDLEWKPTFVAGQPEHPVALVQLASDKVILLIQLSAMKGHSSAFSRGSTEFHQSFLSSWQTSSPIQHTSRPV